MHPVCPVNNVIVTLEKKFYDSITFKSGVKLHVDPAFHPEEYAMLKATVVSVPHSIIDRYDYRGMRIEMKPGDELLVRYDLVFGYKSQPDRDTPIYKNLFLLHDGEKYQEYWLCDLQKVFAIVRDGEFIMQNGYVLLDPVLEQTETISNYLVLPDTATQKQSKRAGIVRAIGAPLANRPVLCVQHGDKVLVLPGTIQHYRVDETEFLICKQSHLLAVA
jgi:co-chaperonin GroES (HSP10)